MEKEKELIKIVERYCAENLMREIENKTAEKDFALTWEDIKTINKILWDLHYEGWPCESEIQDEARFREALKRFNETKKVGTI